MVQAMKAVIFFSILFGLSAAQADSLEAWDLIGDMEARAAQCANNDSKKANIADITAKVNLFATWTGTLNGQNGVVTFLKASNGNYKIKATLDGKAYGPYGVTVCDDNGTYYGKVFGYKAVFEVISKKKIKVYSPLDSSESVIMTKK